MNGYEFIEKSLKNACKKLDITPYQEFLVFIELKYKHETKYDNITEFCYIELDSDNISFVNDWWEGQENIIFKGFAPIDGIMSITPLITIGGKYNGNQTIL